MAFTLNRPGQINSTGNVDAQWLRMFSGETLAQFQDYSVMRSRTMIHSLDHGKSATFPAFGKAVAVYHTPGADLDGQVIAGAEREIFVDDMLTASVWIHKIDQLKTHFDFRSAYSRELAAAMARTFDTNLHQVAILAARASSTVTGGNGGTRIVSANSKTDPDAFVDALSAMQQAFDEKYIPEEDRYCVVSPALYQLLFKANKLINRDYDVGGSIKKGRVGEIYGFEIVKSAHMPSTNVTTGPSAYQGDFRTTTASCFHRTAVGTVQLMEMVMETEYWATRKSTFVSCANAVGHGILRPESAGEIATAALS